MGAPEESDELRLQTLQHDIADRQLNNAARSACIDPLLVRLGVALISKNGPGVDLLQQSANNDSELPLSTIRRLVDIATADRHASAGNAKIKGQSKSATHDAVARGASDVDRVYAALHAVDTADIDVIVETLCRASPHVPSGVISEALIGFQKAMCVLFASKLQCFLDKKKSNDIDDPRVHVDITTIEFHWTLGYSVAGEFKWDGIAAWGDKLYCAPFHASGVLVIDPHASTTRVIKCDAAGKDKWSGTAACGEKLYCAPRDASGVLVIDPQSDKTRVIECDVTGGGKWSGIVACGDKLYCAPFHASGVLEIDPQIDATRVIECGIAGDGKWSGIAAWDGKLYCAPFNASGVLVINLQANTTTVIECGIAGDAKWSGIVACGDKLYCAPWNASGVLVIDPQANTTRVIECGIAGDGKWSGIAACGDKLYCAPFNASDVLVIDLQADTTCIIECDGAGEDKWSGIVAFGETLYCAPYNMPSALVVKQSEPLQVLCGQVQKSIQMLESLPLKARGTDSDAIDIVMTEFEDLRKWARTYGLRRTSSGTAMDYRAATVHALGELAQIIISGAHGFFVIENRAQSSLIKRNAVDLFRSLRLLVGSKLASNVFQIQQQLDKIVSGAESYAHTAAVAPPETATTVDKFLVDCGDTIHFLDQYQSPISSTDAKLAHLERCLSALKGQGLEDKSVLDCLRQALEAATDCVEHLTLPRDYLGAFAFHSPQAY